MLLTLEQLKWLEPAGDNKYTFTGKDKATDDEKAELLALDSDYYDVYRYHIITNLKDLKE